MNPTLSIDDELQEAYQIHVKQAFCDMLSLGNRGGSEAWILNLGLLLKCAVSTQVIQRHTVKVYDVTPLNRF